MPFLATSQTQIPNSNFEDWTIAANGTDSLIGWSSSNAIVISPVISLYSETEAYQGEYAANLVTAPFGFVQYSTIGVLVNGQASFTYGGGGGGANVEYASGGGTPISYKPTALNGYYKTTTLTLGDLPFAKVLLSKYNSDLNSRDTISYSEFNFTANESYTPFSIPLVDLMPGEIPDTITTVFYSSNPTLVNEIGVWSNLYLDSLHLSSSSTTGLNFNSSSPSDLSLIPNPTSGEFSIENLPQNITQIEIYNQLGLRIKSLPTTSENTMQIDMRDYPAGIYFIKSDLPYSSIKKFILTD
jgi:hypothetical protein